jgi:hypothetical protein
MTWTPDFKFRARWFDISQFEKGVLDMTGHLTRWNAVKRTWQGYAAEAKIIDTYERVYGERS